MSNGRAPQATDLSELWLSLGAIGSRKPLRGRARRARESPLSVDEIVRAAIGVADAEGTEALNMRRIAQELGAGTMSLYWHVADKDQLLDLMLDTIYGEDLPVEVTGDWRVDLGRVAHRVRENLWRHRWAIDFIGGRPPHGPNTLLLVEQSLATLDAARVDALEALYILTSVNTYVLGAVLREMQELRGEREEQSSGLSPEQVEAQVAEWRSRLEGSGLFPRLVGLLRQGIDPDAAETRDERFEFGLTCVLDGVAARVESSRGNRPDRSWRA
jgi:AcrR family transcriptional regulator